ncbi:MAG TPA: UTP--glucose-1-phosphate uridylyltransferase [Candidatus Sulfopaludibacter sp.]|nr:UTP--glucose-1-phosphate uridylyltransferase [Candidatus Sulfopaludibacter sp.]
MKIGKAVITAAGRDQRSLPLQTIIDRDGGEKSILGILIEQALAAHIEEVCVVVWPGDENVYRQAAGAHATAVRFVAQAQPLGYGNAIWSANEFTAGEPFLHIVGDHLHLNAGESADDRIVRLSQSEECSVSGVQPTREGLLYRFGAIGGRAVPGRAGLYRVDTVLEKPTPTKAEQQLMMPGVRAGYYLCFIGIHVLTPTVMELLGRNPSATLSDALADLARREPYLALEDHGRRHDLGARYGLLIAQLALALHGRDRSQVLAQLVELLADPESPAGSGQ